jgi:lysozyme
VRVSRLFGLVDDRCRPAGRSEPSRRRPSPDEIAYLLNNDIDDRIDALTRALPWFQNLDDARKAVLLNMAFQMGTDGLLGFKNTLALIRDGKYAEAADAMHASKWAQQTPLRAARLATQMRTGVWQYA